jgi:alkylated DNA repair dioxygenase AlkB
MSSATGSLFPSENIYPNGFIYHPDFIDANQENDLIEIIKQFELRPMMFQGFEAKRRTMSFGYDYSFDDRKISKGKNIPHEFYPLVSRVAEVCHVKQEDFSELLVTEYPVGSVINWHRDAPPFELIAGISVLSDCIFKLRPHDKAKQTRKSIISFPVAHRSLYIIKNEARYDWQHSTAPVKHVRYSITLRTLKQPR